MNCDIIGRHWYLEDDNGRKLGVALSKSKAIRQVSVGSIAPNVERRAFPYFGHECDTSKANVVEGDWAK